MNGWLSGHSDSVLIVPYTTAVSVTCVVEQIAHSRVLAALPVETRQLYLESES